MSEGNCKKTLSAPAVAVQATVLDFQKIPALVPFRTELREVYSHCTGLRERRANFDGAMQAAFFYWRYELPSRWRGRCWALVESAIDADFFGGAWKSILVVTET